MTDKLSKKQVNIQNIIFAVVMAVAAVFLFWKCRYGFANMDESLYIAIPYRFWQGDSMFVHEWNLSSFSSFLLMPFMYIYMAIFGTTEGILLNFRYIFVAVQGICATVVYFKLKRYNWIGAATAAVTFFLYAPFGIMALSYNSMGIQCVALALILLFTNEKCGKAAYIAAGVLFAAAVLCCPYLVAVYALYSVMILINIVRKGCFKLDILQAKCWLWITVGISALAVLFLAFALSRASIKDILTALPLLLDDPYHGNTAISTILSRYFWGILKSNSISIYIFAGYAVLVAVYMFTKNKGVDKSLFFCAAALLTGLFMIPFVTWDFYINYTIFPVNILALVCAIISEDKTVKRLFKIIWIPGMMYGFCIHMASTEGFFNISSSSLTALTASLVIVALTGKECLEKSNINWLRFVTVCAVGAVMLMQISCVWYTRYVSIFWESGPYGGSMYTQTNMADKGPEKGILMSDEKIDMYNRFMEESVVITDRLNAESVLYVTSNTWNYLVSQNAQTASFSAWLPAVDDITLERLGKYYQLNPDRMPQVVYANESYRDFGLKFAQKYGYTETQTQYGNYIYTK